MKRSSKIKKLEEISQSLLTDKANAQSSPAQSFFDILTILESIDNFEKHTNLIAIITHLLQQKLSILADEKKVATDSSGLTVLQRFIKKNYPLPLINTLLSQPEAKHIVLHHESTDSLITDLQKYNSPDPQHDPLINYLALTEQPWQYLIEKCSNYIISNYRSSSPSNLLKTLLTKFGNFPWDVHTKPDQPHPALFGYNLLIFFLCHSPYPMHTSFSP